MFASRLILLAVSAVVLAESISAAAQRPCDTRRTKNNKCCVFPFNYRGGMKYDCGKYNNNEEWCATTNDYDINPSEWGVCEKAPPAIFDRILEANKGAKETKSRAAYGVELFQGDIVMTGDLRYDVYTYMNSRGISTPWDKKPPTRKAGGSRNKRAVMRTDNMRWMRGRKGEVPYEITSSNYNVRGVILRAMRHWEQKVPCLKFIDRRRATGRFKYLSFFSGGGCYSMVGRQGGYGAQRISIGRGCGVMGIVAHEIGHALGFWHEQSRPDRDRYVRINWSNIQRGMSFNFQKYDNRRINSRGISYDYSSLMHYGSTAFANRRGALTIVGTDGRTKLGQRYGLSAKDVQQANLLYCGSGPRPPTPRPPRPPTPRPPPPPGGCRYNDNHRWCPYWKRQGYCAVSSSYSTYMTNNCQKSCICKDKTCKDAFSICGKWSLLGHCNNRRFGVYVRVYCKKSCRACT